MPCSDPLRLGEIKNLVLLEMDDTLSSHLHIVHVKKKPLRPREKLKVNYRADVRVRLKSYHTDHSGLVPYLV